MKINKAVSLSQTHPSLSTNQLKAANKSWIISARVDLLRHQQSGIKVCFHCSPLPPQYVHYREFYDSASARAVRAKWGARQKSALGGFRAYEKIHLKGRERGLSRCILSFIRNSLRFGAHFLLEPFPVRRGITRPCMCCPCALWTETVLQSCPSAQGNSTPTV